MQINPPPTAIPDYELLRPIGRGAFGEVWIARSVTGHCRAVKIVSRDRFSDPAPYEREFRGITQFAEISLREPRQIALLHVGRNDTLGFIYYVMELADDVVTGREINPETYVPCTLREVGRRQGRVPAAEVIRLGLDLAEALVSLHQCGLIHRDLKPSNIILVGGQAKLADIGLVTAMSDANSFVGTLGFVPREGPGTKQADIYGLGKVLYELATGRDRLEFPRLPEGLAELPDSRAFLQLNEIILRACAPLSERYATAQAMRDELEQLKVGESITRARANERLLLRLKWLGGVLAMVALVAVVVGGHQAWQARRESELRTEAQENLYTGQINSVRIDLAAGEYGRARERLAAAAGRSAELDYRGFEWFTLAHEALGDLGKAITPPNKDSTQFSTAASGALIARLGYDHRAEIWSADTNLTLLAVLGGITRLGPFLDSGALAVVRDSRQAVVWNWQTETRPTEPIGPAVALGPLIHNNLLWCQLEPDKTNFCLLDLQTGQKVRSFILPPDADLPKTGLVTLAPDGSRFFVQRYSGQSQNIRVAIELWDIVSARRLWRRPIRMNLDAAAFSPDSRMLALGYAGSSILELRATASGDLLASRTAHAGPINDLSFAPAGPWLASAGGDHLIRLWRLPQLEPGPAFKGLHNGAASVAWQPSGEALICGGDAGDSRLWPLPPELQPRSETAAAGVLTNLYDGAGGGLCLDPQGRWLAASASADTIEIRHTGDLTRHGLLTNAFTPVGFLSDDLLLSLSPDHRLQHWRWRTGELAAVSDPLSTNDVNVACLTPDRRRILIASETGEITLWDAKSLQLAQKLESHAAEVWAGTVSADGVLAATGDDTHIFIWDLAASRCQLGFKLRFGDNSAQLWSLAISPDHRWLAAGTGRGEVLVYDLQARGEPRILAAPGYKIQSVTFSPDGRRLVTGSTSGSLGLWDTRKWKPVTTLFFAPREWQLGNRSIWSLHFDDSGHRLAAFAGGGSLRLWDCRPISLGELQQSKSD